MASNHLRQCTKKLTEEALEVALAAIDDSDRKVVAESADLLYRLEDLLKARGISLDRIVAELKSRTERPLRMAKALKRRSR